MPNLTLRVILTYTLGIATFPLTQRLFGSLFSELRGRWQSSAAARRLIDTQLDPLLKAADELQGKLRSLAEEDFRDFRRLPDPIVDRRDLVNLCSTLYLFSQFWARLEILRRESFHADLAQNKKGAILLRFLRSLESRRVRLVDRAWQRAIGECTIAHTGDKAEVIQFKNFVEQFESEARLRQWLQPLERIIRDSKLPRSRQRVLQYGVVVHALIDTLDPKHLTTRERPAYPNKLSERAKRDMVGRVFGVYLPDVENVTKYVGARRMVRENEKDTL
jgi:hypothetical protein